MDSKIGFWRRQPGNKFLVFTRALLFSNGRSLQTQKFVLLPCQIPHFCIPLCILVFLFTFVSIYLVGETIEVVNKHILLTGVPGVGKSTIIKKVLQSFSGLVQGVYAEEEVVGDERVGFIIRTLEGKSAYLAHQDLPSLHRVGKYGVNVEAIESLVIPAISSTQT
jgi:NTPase